MHSEVSVRLAGNQEFRFDLASAEPMTHEEGRHWLDDQFTSLDCEPLRASGKVLLADKGYEEKRGARPLGRVIQEHIKKPLAEELLFGKLAKGGLVKVGVSKGALKLTLEGPQNPRLSGDKPPLLTAE